MAWVVLEYKTDLWVVFETGYSDPQKEEGIQFVQLVDKMPADYLILSLMNTRRLKEIAHPEKGKVLLNF